MSYGVNIQGVNNSFILTNYASNYVFRGKANFISGSQFFPTAAPASTTIIFYNYAGRSITQSVSASGDNVFRAYENDSIPVSEFKASAVQQSTIAALRYEIVCYGAPIVFFNTSTHTIKGTVASIQQNGDVSGVPKWEILVYAGFPAGTAVSTTVAALTLYCFSQLAGVEAVPDHGIEVYRTNGELAYSSTFKPLVIKDYVTITGSNNPANISALVYSRTFATNPVQSVFSIAKPGFQNIDFARYTWKQYILSDGDGSPYSGVNWTVYRLYLYQFFITSGVSINSTNTDLDFGLQTMDAQFSFEDLTNNSSSTYFDLPPVPNVISSKSESFPVVIPIINCADYD